MDRVNKLYKVVVSDSAVNMLMQHAHFVAQVSMEAAEKLRLDIVAAMKSLEDFPERNSWVPSPLLPANKYRKMTVSKRYVVIYQIKDDAVLVDYILDCRQEHKWLL